MRLERLIAIAASGLRADLEPQAPRPMRPHAKARAEKTAPPDAELDAALRLAKIV
ncbi:MAG: hypothetical protein AB7L65_03610 [Hyphomonadaceae bacterium]